MYNNFFGFKEKPFKLVPNPAYLFLSKSHEEAMAHLTYAVSQGDGFVALTGEVGTGKTTLCRAFLDNLDHTVEAAYIFNPKLDALQLLKTINDEFSLASEPDNIKQLIDILNNFLLVQKSINKKVIILIDEAQNLSRDVLEQLRLLSNLETTRDKLLQIILVGQPELADMLASHQLRQLGQRITLSCRLTPLTLPETREYILHRITIAARRPGLKFDQAALKVIHSYSGGVPRLINIAADRALLTAYGLNRHSITEKIAKIAIHELADLGAKRIFRLPAVRRFAPSLALLFMAFLATFFLLRPDHSSRQMTNEVGLPTIDHAESTTSDTPVPQQPAEPHLSEPATTSSQTDPTTAQNILPEAPSAPEGPESPSGLKITNLAALSATLDYRSSRHLALQSAIEPWTATPPTIRKELDTLKDDLTFFRLAVKQSNLQVRRVNNTLELLRQLDLPAILELHYPNEPAPRYLTISRISQDRIGLRAGNILVETRPEELARYWQGIAYVPWNNFLNIIGTVPRNAPEESIITLKMLLRDLGYRDVAMTPKYDQATRQIIKDLQQKHGLENDGKVGPLTKIILYRQIDDYAMPRIGQLTGKIAENES